MKILIISDSHGNRRMLDQVAKKAGAVDAVFHLGDVEGDEDYLEAIMPCPVYMVAGNNDFYSNLPETAIVQVGKYKIFMSHGHGYYVSLNTRRLKEIAKERGADIAMYGHTHRPDIDYADDIIVINPGSIAYPRQEGRRPTYIMMCLDENGEAQFELFQM